MREMERQALQAERKKAAEAAAASAHAAQPATPALPSGTETPSSGLDADNRATEALVVTPAPESVPRSDGDPAQGTTEASAVPSNEPSHDPSHDQQQPV
jgi:hypothetical protein